MFPFVDQHDSKPILLETDVAAVAAGRSARTIRRWVASGRLTNHGTGKRVLVDLAEVQAVDP